MVHLDSWAGRCRIICTMVGSVSRMFGLSGRVVLWGCACFNIDPALPDDYFFCMTIHFNTTILPFS